MAHSPARSVLLPQLAEPYAAFVARMTLMRPCWQWHRSAAFLITLFGIFINFAATAQVLAASRSLKWEQEFEWDTSNAVDGVKVLWGVLFAYFSASAAICTIGFVGVVKVRRLMTSATNLVSLTHALYTSVERH